MRTFGSERGSEGILPEVQVKNFGEDPLGVARNGSSERPLTRSSSSLSLPLPLQLASSQYQTTHCLPDYRRKTKCERVPIPLLPVPIASLFPPLPFPITSPSLLLDIAN